MDKYGSWRLHSCRRFFVSRDQDKNIWDTAKTIISYACCITRCRFTAHEQSIRRARRMAFCFLALDSKVALGAKICIKQYWGVLKLCVVKAECTEDDADNKNDLHTVCSLNHATRDHRMLTQPAKTVHFVFICQKFSKNAANLLKCISDSVHF